MVLTSSETAAGFTQDQLDQAFLDALEERLLQMARAHARRNMEAQGLDVSYRILETMTAASHYIQIRDRKIAVTKFYISGDEFSATISGIVGNQFIRVGCINESPMPVNLGTGECDAAIRAAFGISLAPFAN